NRSSCCFRFWKFIPHSARSVGPRQDHRLDNGLRADEVWWRYQGAGAACRSARANRTHAADSRQIQTEQRARRCLLVTERAGDEQLIHPGSAERDVARRQISRWIAVPQTPVATEHLDLTH